MSVSRIEPVQASTAKQHLELSLEKLITASSFLSIRSSKLALRVRRSVALSSVACEGVLLALSEVRERAFSAAQAVLRASEKVMDEQLEEVTGNENILMAAASLSEARTRSLLLLTELEAVASLSQLFYNELRNQDAHYLISLRSPSALQLDCLLALHRDDVDPARIRLGGLGSQRFVLGAAVQSNVITVTPYTASGVLAEFIMPDDVVLSITSTTGAPIECHSTATASEPGEIRVQYCISAQPGVRVTNICISFIVCDCVIAEPLLVKLGYDASSTRRGDCLHGIDGGKAGLAVTDDTAFLATSDYEECVLRIFQLRPRVTLLKKIGGRGSLPGQLLGPCRLCFTPAGNLLVCELGNHRVQHLTMLGQSLHCTTLIGAYAIAISPGGAGSKRDSLLPVAVSTRYGTIELRTFSEALGLSDTPVRVMSSPTGDASDGSHALATNICFSPACQFIVAAWQSKKSGLTMYTSAGDLVVTNIGVGLVDEGVKGVAFAASGELIVCATKEYPYADSKIHVFTPDGATHLRAWGCSGVRCAEFVYPTMLATAGQYLFVMDSGRIQRFE